MAQIRASLRGNSSSESKTKKEPLEEVVQWHKEPMVNQGLGNLGHTRTHTHIEMRHLVRYLLIIIMLEDTHSHRWLVVLVAREL